MKSPPIPRFPEVPGLAKYLEDLSRVIETNSQPQTGSQPYDSNLRSLSSPFGLTAAGLALLDDIDAAAQRATLGAAIAETTGLTATTSGTFIDVTGIPATATQLVIAFSGVSTNGISLPIVQIGDSGGIEISGYVGSKIILTATSAVSALSSGVEIGGTAAANAIYGICEFILSSTNTWVFRAQTTNSTGSFALLVTGAKNLSATLDRFRLTTAGGVDIFDAGSIRWYYS